MQMGSSHDSEKWKMNEKMSDEKWIKKEVEVKKCTSRYVALT